MPLSVTGTDTGKRMVRGLALLTACARHQFTDQSEDTIEGLLRSGIDWEFFLRAARRHGMIPLLYWHLQSCAGSVPPAVLTELHNYFRINSERNLLLAQEMIRLLGLLEAHRIPVIVFKGPLLAVMAYGNPSLRRSADLDILVHEQDVPRLKVLLNAEGYQSPPSFCPTLEPALIDYGNEYLFVYPSVGIQLDVHWRMFPRYLSFALDDAPLWERIQHLLLGGRRVPTISREDLLIVLCVHGSKHLWERLSWICDIAGLIAGQPPMDWTRILDQAEGQGSSLMLFLGLALAYDLAGTELPSKVAARIHDEPVIATLAAQVQRWLSSDIFDLRPLHERAIFFLRLARSLKDKVRCLSAFAFTPTTADLQFLPPSAWIPLPFYHVVRPFRLLTKYGASALATSKWNRPDERL